MGAKRTAHFLSLGDEMQVVSYVDRVTATPGDQTHGSWLERRDATIVALMLGGGLKVSEVASLRLSAVHETRMMVMPIRHGRRTTQILLRPFACAALMHWCREGLHRAGADVGRRSARAGVRVDPLVFPAMAKGGRAIRGMSVDHAMHVTSIFRRTQAVLQRAGLPVQAPAVMEDSAGSVQTRLCPQTLRNTFYAVLMEAEMAEDTIIEYLGLRDPLSIARLNRAYRGSMRRREWCADREAATGARRCALVGPECVGQGG